jgi:MYXO-CTERM domain-containing protein
MGESSRSAVCGALSLVLLGACVATEDNLGQTVASLAQEGAWEIPAEVLAIGDTQYVDYTGAGPWQGSDSCQGGMTAGAEDLRDYINAYFPQVTRIGGYACRHINGNENQTSVHATGRALDIHIPRAVDQTGDNDLGDPLAHWLIRNAEFIGVQYIIWDRYSWNASRDAGEKGRAYGGASPHYDHLHVELSVEAGARGTPWFEEDWTAPHIAECAPLPREGGVLDDGEGCTQILGPSKYWRHEEGAGYGDALFWTNAVERDEPSNWARWQIDMAEAGEYELEVYIDPDFSAYTATRYQLVHAGQTVEMEVDQSAADGWHPLGSFDFAAGAEQHLELFDNSDHDVAEEQQIAADAIRLTRLGDSSEPGVDGEIDPDSDFGDVLGGCESSGGSSGLSGLLVLGMGLFAARRRRN